MKLTGTLLVLGFLMLTGCASTTNHQVPLNPETKPVQMSMVDSVRAGLRTAQSPNLLVSTPDGSTPESRIVKEMKRADKGNNAALTILGLGIMAAGIIEWKAASDEISAYDDAYRESPKWLDREKTGWTLLATTGLLTAVIAIATR